MAFGITIEPASEIRRVMFVDAQGYSACSVCAHEHRDRFASQSSVSPGDLCALCGADCYERPIEVFGTAVVEHFPCKIF